MRENTSWKNEIFKCPYCKANSTFSCIFSVKGDYKGLKYPISVWRCHYCDRGIFIKHKESPYDHVVEQGFEVDTIFPSNEPDVDTRVPEGIAVDFIEAAKCFNISAYKASAVMSRRTIQKMCVNLGADRSNNLYKQIKEL